MREYIGVDFDGTLATYRAGMGPTELGEPIMPMVARVRRWLAQGEEVRIITARVFCAESSTWSAAETEAARRAIVDWCARYLGAILPVQCHKDEFMRELWDDRARQVETNTGRAMTDRVRALLLHCPDMNCEICGRIMCPSEDPLHFHPGGCPSCEA